MNGGDWRRRLTDGYSFIRAVTERRDDFFLDSSILVHAYYDPGSGRVLSRACTLAPPRISFHHASARTSQQSEGTGSEGDEPVEGVRDAVWHAGDARARRDGCFDGSGNVDVPNFFAGVGTSCAMMTEQNRDATRRLPSFRGFSSARTIVRPECRRRGVFPASRRLNLFRTRFNASIRSIKLLLC